MSTVATPEWQQLSGLLAFAKAQLRADAYLTGSGVGQLNYNADDVCHTTYPHQAVDMQGPERYVKFGKAQLAVLAIYPKEMEAESVRGSLGMSVPLGIQYIFTTRSKDIAAHHHDMFFAATIWWKLVDLLFTDITKSHDPAATVPSTLATTYHIETLSLESAKLHPQMLPDSMRLLEGSACMEFKRPPWDTGEDSSQVVDLSSIYTDHDEVGPSGAEPLIQSQYDVPEE
jgi:hypothetical protein